MILREWDIALRMLIKERTGDLYRIGFQLKPGLVRNGRKGMLVGLVPRLVGCIEFRFASFQMALNKWPRLTA